MTMLPDDIEEWRPVTRAPEYYEVSTLGRIRRALHAPHARTGSTWPGRLLSPVQGHHDYRSVHLRCEGKALFHGPVHILIAEAFLGPRPTRKHTVNHIDGVGDNNRASNLEWATPLEQTRHAIKLGLMDPNHLKQYRLYGEGHRKAKLTDEIVRVIRYAPSRFSSLDLAELFGVGTSTISNIRRRKNWSHVV